MPVKCFFLVATAFTSRSLRRYKGSDEVCSASGIGFHNASVEIDQGVIGESSTTVPSELDKTDPRWPTDCACGYQFLDSDHWQLDVNQLYARADDASLIYTLRSAPVGAMWYADWYLREGSNECRGPDGHCLVVRTPGGDWIIDARASNCGSPDDDQHKCWVRHGEPPNITVDKNGHTCTAGAGSILQNQGKPNEYHGFLQHGQLT